MSADAEERRRHWLKERQRMEALLASRRRSTPFGERALPPLASMGNFIAAVFRLSGLYRRGHRNAADFRLEHVAMAFSHLPDPFDGYRILHLSDLHVGNVSTLMDRATRSLSGLAVDLVVMSGDFQTRATPSATEAAALIDPLLKGLVARDGAVAVLGNHDSHEMAGALDTLGVQTLINESITIERMGTKLMVVGTDDVNSFYTEAAPMALRHCEEGFRIAVVHTAELASVAASAGYSLYLTGHTHGGQICLPGGKPLATALDTHRSLASGSWHWHGMLGYTSRGLGSGKPPLRFNCPPEATVISLIQRPL